MAGTPTQYYGFPTYADSDAVDLTAQYNTAVTKIDSELHQMDVVLDNRNKRFCVYFGNSYSAGTEGIPGLYARTKDLYDESKAYLGSGSGFLDVATSQGPSFVTLAAQAAADDSIDHSRVTDVLVLGAWGDSRAFNAGKTVADFNTAAKNFAGIIQSTYPNVRNISYAWCECRSKYNVGNSTFADSAQVHISATAIFDGTPIRYLGWVGLPNLYTSAGYTSDGYHPNDFGYKLIERGLRARITGAAGTLARTYQMKPSIPLNGGTLTGNMNVTVSEDAIDLSFGQMATSGTFSGGAITESVIDVTDDSTLFLTKTQSVVTPALCLLAPINDARPATITFTRQDNGIKLNGFVPNDITPQSNAVITGCRYTDFRRYE